MPPRRNRRTPPKPDTYKHPEADSVMRPEVGTQAQFRKKKPPTTYRYDSSLSPLLEWDGQNAAREVGEALIRRMLDAETLEDAKAAAAELARMSKPFLNWAGKAERLSFDVPTLPLFIHERLSTRAILDTLKRHRKDQQTDFLDLFGDPQHSITDQVLRAYEHRDRWVNRLILGDSLVVMNSLLQYEGLGGQVQMIYIDPPYGVKFGSNFQPFVRKRDVKHNDDGDLTREPEMVQAYRDTWELGLHSYLTYLRDRLLVARELLKSTGSIFVQIGDDNLHHVREVLDEVFGPANLVNVITVVKTSAQEDLLLPSVCDYLLWYAKDIEQVKYRQIWLQKGLDEAGTAEYNRVELEDGIRRRMTREEQGDWDRLPDGSKPYRQDNIVSQRPPGSFPVEFEGKTYRPITGYWKTGESGMQRLIEARRIEVRGRMLSYVRFFNDFPLKPLANFWPDTRFSSRSEDKAYVVQTAARVIERCVLMTTDPGDMVLDPTCGSGTTAFVAEQWGRRWITIDTSRVPLALTRQRLLTGTFDWFDLKDESRGPAGGFVYQRKQNNKGEEVGGIVPHVTLKSIANNEPPVEEVLVDRPEKRNDIVRVTGPFTFEATIPTPVDWEGDGTEDSSVEIAENYTAFVDRMLEILRRSPVLRLEGNRSITLKNVRPPAKTLVLSAEALVNGNGSGGQAVAFVFGPENGAVSEKLVYEAAREAHAKAYMHLYVIGFAIEPNARELVENAAQVMGVPATYVQATPDLLMGDLLKNMRSSQIFSVCGLPEIKVERVKPRDKNDAMRYQVKLEGLDTFDPVTMDVEHRKGDDVPCWLLDTDYNGRCFRVAQAFFPRTSAWENLKKALRADYEESVWQHLAGTTSAPFEPGSERKIAVKVIDDRGNELLVVRDLQHV